VYKKLFIPGPTHVDDEILAAMSVPMIGHRDKLYSDLHGDVVSKLKKFLQTEGRIYLSTSSSTGMMEGSIRNCVKKKALMTDCGAFSKRWVEIAQLNGKEIDVIKVDMGKATTPEMVDEYLSKGGFDTVCITHNETSTGVMNPIEEIGKLVKEKYPDVLVLVDAVSSMGGAEIKVDEWGLDVVLAGTQKAFALPPGLCVVTVSDAAFDYSAEVENKGFYFNFEALEKKAIKNQTPKLLRIKPRPLRPSASLMPSMSKWIESSRKALKIDSSAISKWQSLSEPGQKRTLLFIAMRIIFQPL